MEVLFDILKWVNERSAPNQSRKYSRCPVCESAWWDNKEQHRFDCWVPRAKRAAEQSLHTDFGKARRFEEDTPGQFDPTQEDLFKPAQSG